jgi:hypothetical protein
MVHLRCCILREHSLVWENWIVYGYAIHRNTTCCGKIGSFTELLFSGNFSLFGSSGSIMDLLFSENSSWCWSSGSFTELLFTGSLLGVGKVVH